MSALHTDSEEGAASRYVRRDSERIAEANENGSRASVVRSARTGTEIAVRQIIRSRAERIKFLPPRLFADPAWDMLLELYLADILSKRISVTSLCGASKVPATTALRWINTLKGEGLINRTHDPYDHRRYFVSLSGKAMVAMDGFFRNDAALNMRGCLCRPLPAPGV